MEVPQAQGPTVVPCEPHLGCATTDELLCELIARFEVDATRVSQLDAETLIAMRARMSPARLGYSTVG